MFPTVGLIMNVSSVAVVWIGAGRIDTGAIQIGSLVAYLTYVVQILMGVVIVTFMVSMIPRAGVAAERIVDVLETEPTVRRPVDPVTETTKHGTVELRNVSFRYPGAVAGGDLLLEVHEQGLRQELRFRCGQSVEPAHRRTDGGGVREA